MPESYKNKPDLRFFLFPSLFTLARLSYYEDRNGNQYTLILPRKRPGFNDMPCNLSNAHAGFDHNCPAVPETQYILCGLASAQASLLVKEPIQSFVKIRLIIVQNISIISDYY